MAYQEHRYGWLRSRAQAVAWFALTVNFAYCLSDLTLLAPELHTYTIAIRLFVMSPPVLGVLWALKKGWSARYFAWLYGATYLIAGLGIVAIIGVARWQNVALPYEGMLLITMFGYLIMGLTFRIATFTSLVLLIAYLGVEMTFVSDVSYLIYNVFFLLTTNAIGAVGAYLQEKNHRNNFLLRREAEAAKRRADQENAAKTRLLASASHDLRQPLHAMNLQLENLLGSWPHREQNRQLEALGRSLRQLNQLLGDLLDLSRLEAGVIKPNLTDFELVGLLRMLVEQVPQSESTHLALQLPESPVWVNSDRTLIARMLGNLLDNANRHAKASEIWLRLHVEPQGRVCIEVADNGIGIPESARESVFEEYTSLGLSEQGLGIGLTIVKRSAELLGIPMELDTGEAKGASFKLWLHTVQPKNKSEFAFAQGLGLKGKRIVLVDDEPEVLSAACELLQSWEMDVLATHRAEEALVSLRQHPNSLLLTDVHLGIEVNGAELLERARREGFKGGALLWTADTAFDVDQKMDALQPAFCVRKPLRPAKLKQLLQLLAEKASSGLNQA